MSEENTDRVIQELRGAISDNDRAIVRALNKRIELVGRLKRHKEEQGIAFVEPQQEEAGAARASGAHPGAARGAGADPGPGPRTRRRRSCATPRARPAGRSRRTACAASTGRSST